MIGDFVPLWIPTVFTAVLILFFIAAFFLAPRMSEGQLKIVRFLAALCGAISAFMWTGEALLKARGQVGGLELGFSGTAGFAIFFLVWISWDKTAHASIGYNISVAPGWTFEHAAQKIAETGGGNLVLSGFSGDDKMMSLRAEKLFGDNAKQALEKLRRLAPDSFPRYDVAYDGQDYTLTVR